MQSLMARKKKLLPLIIEKDQDGWYVVECPLFSGCYSQGKTLREAKKNIEEVIDLCLEEKQNKDILRLYTPQEVSFEFLSV